MITLDTQKPKMKCSHCGHEGEVKDPISAGKEDFQCYALGNTACFVMVASCPKCRIIQTIPPEMFKEEKEAV